MSRESRRLLTAAAVLLAAATALGAYAAHGLEHVLAGRGLDNFRTGVQYHFFHALGLLGVALLRDRFPDSAGFALCGWLLLAGIVLFSGSLYVTSFGVLQSLTAAAPVGGLAFIAGWLALAWGAWRLPR